MNSVTTNGSLVVETPHSTVRTTLSASIFAPISPSLGLPRPL